VPVEVLLVAVIVVALFFDFTNGFQDAANAIATSVSTRAISPRLAVLGAAILNFLGAFVSVQVAATVATGVVDAAAVTLEIVLAGLAAAIAWNLIAWYFGMPTSASHALIGGVAGAAVGALGWEVLLLGGLVNRVLVPSVLAPFIGVVTAAAIMVAVLWIVRSRAPGTVNRIFRRLQLVSAGFVAFTHGTNDAQKTMGIMVLALMAGGYMDPDAFRVPIWVIASAAAAMAFGTYVGGWRIIRTLGQRVAKLEPPQGFAAESATASILWVTGNVGFPVSTTHTISGSVLGAGATRRLTAVRWGVAGNILVAWLLTVPAAATVGAAMERVTRLPGGTIIVVSLVAAIAALAFAARRQKDEAPETLVSPPPAWRRAPEPETRDSSV
jgi:inorganic phosphate transporter, PiT family